MNPKARLIEISSFAGDGMDEWIDWLFANSLRIRTSHKITQPLQECWEWWYG